MMVVVKEEKTGVSRLLLPNKRETVACISGISSRQTLFVVTARYVKGFQLG